MAARKFTRARRATIQSSSEILADIGHRLQTAHAVTLTAVAALKRQAADADTEIALALQRCVGDEISRQVERLSGLIEPQSELAT